MPREPKLHVTVAGAVSPGEEAVAADKDELEDWEDYSELDPDAETDAPAPATPGWDPAVAVVEHLPNGISRVKLKESLIPGTYQGLQRSG